MPRRLATCPGGEEIAGLARTAWLAIRSTAEARSLLSIDAVGKRFEEREWSGLDDVAAETLRDGGTEDAMRALAHVARARALDGHADDAARLAHVVLRAVDPDAADEGEDDGSYHRLQTRVWSRWCLHVLVREAPDGLALDALSEADRAAIAIPDAPMDLPPPADLEALEAQIDERLPLDDGIAFADALWASVRAIDRCEKDGLTGAVMRACRAVLSRYEKAVRAVSEEGEAALAPLQRTLRHALLRAWQAAPDDDPEYRETREWMLAERSGAVRIIDFDPEAMTERARKALLAALEEKHERARTTMRYAFAMLHFGKGLIDEERYVSLARDLGATQTLVEVLLEVGRSGEAAEAALEAVRGEGGPGHLEALDIAKMLDAAGETDAAIAIMQVVTKDSLESSCDHWLAQRLSDLDRDEEALAVLERRFHKRTGLSTYGELREHAPEKAWPALREKIMQRLAQRRLHRVIIDIALEEKDADLLEAHAEGLDDGQREYLASRLDVHQDVFEPKFVEKLVASLARGSQGSVVFRHPSVPPPARVRHAKYGVGDVVSHEGEGEERKLTIEFKTFGTKTILERFVKPVTD